MDEINRSKVRIGTCIEEHLSRHETTTPRIMNGITKLVELLIIDEAERLTSTALELLRDNHDRTHLAIILIGMPGIDQRFRHYFQLQGSCDLVVGQLRCIAGVFRVGGAVNSCYVSGHR